MKTPPRIELPRVANEQDLLRLFAAGRGPDVPVDLRYLAAPCYHFTGQGEVTLAGDGTVFVWRLGKVPGFADYIVPPEGFDHFSVPSLWRMYKASAQTVCPFPAGAWGSRQADNVFVGQQPARLNRYVLARLSAFHSAWIGPGERWDTKGTVGWRTVSVRAHFGEHMYRGVIFCEEPEVLKTVRKVTRKKEQAKRQRAAAK